MRWICKDDIEVCLTSDWRKVANKAKQALFDANSQEERKLILKKVSSSRVWHDFFNLLPENIKNKCWYCETEEIRSDKSIDHFRPKGKVDDELSHDGYWWLAFDWDNYRCACTFCNSRRNFEETNGGKGCKFPLVNKKTRIFTPNDDDNTDGELPNFLDPFDPDDEKLLWFDEDGKPEPKPDANKSQRNKVNNSIDIFHLHEVRLARARNEIRINIEKEVKKIRDNCNVREAKINLRRMVRSTEKLSRAAVVYLRMHRDLEEVKDILQLD